MNGAIEKYNTRAEKVQSLLCVGLDSDVPESQLAFNKRIIEQTHEFVSAYKLNIAFYEARGKQGMRELKTTMDYLQSAYSDIFTICDAKRGDIANTNAQYAKAYFDWYGFDAITLHAYMGKESLQPFLDYKDKGCIILARTSNPGAREFQDQKIGEKPLWYVVAETVAKEWNENGNCMLVAGATYPEELKIIRGIVSDMPLLVPGIGAQGGDIKAAVQAGLDSHGMGLIIVAGRSIIFAEDPGKAARALREDINQWRTR